VGAGLEGVAFLWAAFSKRKVEKAAALDEVYGEVVGGFGVFINIYTDRLAEKVVQISIQNAMNA